MHLCNHIYTELLLKEAIKIDKITNRVFTFVYHIHSSPIHKLNQSLVSCLNTLEHPRKSKNNL